MSHLPGNKRALHCTEFDARRPVRCGVTRHDDDGAPHVLTGASLTAAGVPVPSLAEPP